MVEDAEPVRVEALITEPAVETLHVAVLHRPAGLDVHDLDLALLGPAEHAPAAELRARSTTRRHKEGSRREVSGFGRGREAPEAKPAGGEVGQCF